ncbi:NADH-quinone oxidoreductase subunit C [Rhodococcus sp. X156]|uniref:NADH-quinone oxidoreductase subunit C n=1 Tax=Rhodococcus sp. X156 TaxID=2499145 RepID=UPI0019D05164|nr:NADH-quinone oxidoreductase subunit C [Rhodococcus sp. X156]
MSVGDAGLARALVQALGVGEVTESFDQHTAQVPLPEWVRAATVARDELGCSMFDHLAVHDAGGPGGSGASWEVTAHVVVPAGCRGLLVRTTVAVDGELPSITGVWAGAAWHEREAAEMAGLEVTGHPDLRPLLLAPGAGLHPLRKDTVLASRGVRPWPGRMEPGEGAAPTSAGRRRASAPGVPGQQWEQPGEEQQ